MNISCPEEITSSLHKALERLGKFENCALLDYPNYTNLGDHLIWLGSVFYLTDVLKTKINYVASITDFSATVMEKQIGKAPILLNGGGNLGDLWPRYQTFREQIISQYRDRPVIVLPQSIYFNNKENLYKTAESFNSHPNLTLFVRDNRSYEIAIKHFYNCQVIKAPDMAFQLLQVPGTSVNYKPTQSALYLYRQDRELNQMFFPSAIDIPNLVVEDWVSFKWVLGNPKSKFIQSIAHLVREVWQRGLATPNEWLSRQIWQQSYLYKNKFNTLYRPELHRRSWSFLHSGIYQFKHYRLIITNRLHGHILCTILGIPHVFLPNSYHKNESFYETWTYKIPFCRFVKEPSQIKGKAQELIEAFSDN